MKFIIILPIFCFSLGCQLFSNANRKISSYDKELVVIKPPVNTRETTDDFNSQSIRGILSIKPDGSFDKLSDVTEVEALIPGSIFPVKSPQRVTWVTAAHVIDAVKKIGGQHYLLSEKSSAIGFTKYTELFALAESDSLVINPTSITYDPTISYDKDTIGDFSRFTSLDTSTAGIDLRDMIKDPLVFDESINVLGRQGGRLIKINCKFSGVFEQTLHLGGIVMALECNNIPGTDQGEVHLAGVSGGAVIDSSGKVVGVFNGFTKFTDETGYIITLRFTPIFLGLNDDIGLVPDSTKLKNNQLNVNCLQFSETKKVIDYKTDKLYARKLCQIKFDSLGFSHDVKNIL